MAEPNEVDVPVVVTVGLVSVFLTVATIFGVQALFFNYEQVQLEQKVISAKDTAAETHLASEETRLASYGWVDREKQRVAIPIERAMGAVVRELGD
jgi:hypothetical protein